MAPRERRDHLVTAAQILDRARVSQGPPLSFSHKQVWGVARDEVEAVRRHQMADEAAGKRNMSVRFTAIQTIIKNVVAKIGFPPPIEKATVSLKQIWAFREEEHFYRTGQKVFACVWCGS